MSRDMQPPYEDDQEWGRSGARGGPSGQRPSAPRGGMSGPRGSVSRGGNTPPGGRANGSGRLAGPPNSGLIRPPLPGRGNGDHPSAPRSGAQRAPDRYGASYGSPSGSRRAAGRSNPGYDDEGAGMSGRSGALRGASGRSMGDRFRDAGRSMSRQFSAMMEGAGRAMRQEFTNVGRSFEGPPPSMLAGGSVAPRSRRTRARSLLRKWRQRRIRRNPAAFAVTFIMAVMVSAAVIGASGAGSVYAFQYYTSKRGAIQAAALQGDAQSTRIFDRNGNLLYLMPRAGTGYQFSLKWGQFGNTIVNATLDTEDHTFWSNNGIDLYSTIRALYVDALHGGAADQGASTITQQLVKSLVLKNPEKTLDRKIHEAILAIGITKNNGLDPNGFEKWKILEMYLNNIYYGDQNYGVEVAARNYFGLVPTDTQTATQQLSLAQAAILVRIPNDPGQYAPFANGYNWSCPSAPCDPSHGKVSGCAKWHNGPGNEENVCAGAFTVLYNMYTNGDIKSNRDLLKAENDVVDILTNETIYHWKYVRNSTSNSQQIDKKAPHFVDYVIKQLETQFGMQDDRTLANAGLSVYTTLDYGLEKEIEDDAFSEVEKPFVRHWYCNPYYHNSCNVPALKDSDNVNNMAATAIDPHTGDILAMMGSVNYGSQDPHVLGYLNMATTPRSMGSSTKPLVYATAFQMGWYPGVMMQDIPVCFPGLQPKDKSGNYPIDPAAPACQGYYVPHNYDATSFSGTAPVRAMLANSLNIGATEAMYFVGADYGHSANFMDMIGRMGIHTCEDCDNMVSSRRLGPTTALGTQEIPLIELTSAFGTFAASGQHVPPRAILRIDDSSGETIWTAPVPKPAYAISPQAAYMITSILTDNLARAGDFKIENPLCFTCYPDFLDFGNKANNSTQYVAAKTGTAQGDGGPTDVVTMGYSNFMALGVWAGNTKNHDWLGSNIIGITGAGYIFHDAMAWAIKNYKWPAIPFPVPAGMTRGQFNCNTGLAPYKGTDPAAFSGGDPNAPGNGWCRLSGSGTDLYDGFATGRKLPDQDWIIQGQFPDVS